MHGEYNVMLVATSIKFGSEYVNAHYAQTLNMSIKCSINFNFKFRTLQR